MKKGKDPRIHVSFLFNMEIKDQTEVEKKRLSPIKG